jgi:hypothetical protein
MAGRFRTYNPSVIDAMTHNAINATNPFAMTGEVASRHKLQLCFTSARIL